MSFRAGLPFLLCALPLFLTAGCSSAPVPQSTVRVAVLDGLMDEDASETRRSLAGWWFFAKDHYDNGNAGHLSGEALAGEIQRMPGARVYSRTDLDIYMRQKEHLLAVRYPRLGSQERLELLRNQDPLDYGRSLNVDYVVTSRIHKARTTHHRTLHWWKSDVELTIGVWDVNDQRLTWEWRTKEGDLFSSQLRVLQHVARDTRKRLQKADVFGVY